MLYTNYIFGFATLLSAVAGTFIVPKNSSSTAISLTSGDSRFYYQADDLSIHSVSTDYFPNYGYSNDVVIIPSGVARASTPLTSLIWAADDSHFGTVWLIYINANNQLSQLVWTDASNSWSNGSLNSLSIPVTPQSNFLYAIGVTTQQTSSRIGFLTPAGDVCEAWVYTPTGTWGWTCY